MMASYMAAFTPGTQANQSRQAKIYLMFMRAYNFDPYNPSLISLLLYLQILANSFENITTIKNYVLQSWEVMFLISPTLSWEP